MGVISGRKYVVVAVVLAGIAISAMTLKAYINDLNTQVSYLTTSNGDLTLQLSSFASEAKQREATIAGLRFQMKKEREIFSQNGIEKASVIQSYKEHIRQMEDKAKEHEHDENFNCPAVPEYIIRLLNA